MRRFAYDHPYSSRIRSQTSEVGQRTPDSSSRYSRGVIPSRQAT
jgi:hypothetical protein